MIHTRRLLQLLLIVAAACAVALPAVAPASGRDVIRDCADDGRIDGDYSDRELEDAENDLPSDIDEYTDCREAIRAERAKRRRADEGGGGSGGGGGTGGPIDPALVTSDGAVAGSSADIEALGEITRRSKSGEAPEKVDLGTGAVTPGETSGGKVLGVAASGNDLPGPVLVLLILLAVLTLGGVGLLAARHRHAALAAGRPAAWSRIAPGLRRVSPLRLFKR